MAQDPNQSADALFFQGDELIKSGRIAEGKEAMEKAIEKDPKHGRAYNHLGWLMESKFQDFAKAEEYYKKALEFAPEYCAAYLNYALVLSSMAKFDELDALLKKAMDVPGINKSRLHNEYGLMYEQQGKFKEAIDAYKTGIQLALNDGDVDAYMASVKRCEKKMAA